MDMLPQILKSAQQRNSMNNITGMLFYGSGHFMQSIEGPDEEVRELIVRIGKDKRHRNIQIIANREIEHRMFPNWWMGLSNMDDRVLLSEEYCELIQTNLDDIEDSSEYEAAVLEFFRDFCEYVGDESESWQADA